MTRLERLKRWQEVGDDPDPTYCAGNDQFAADVLILLNLVVVADRLRGEGYEPRPSIARVQAYDHVRAGLDADAAAR